MIASNKNILTPYLKSLFLEPPNLTPNDLATVLRCIFRGIPSEVQVTAFLTALKMRGLDHKPEFIAAAVNTLLEFASIIPPEDVSPDGYVDIVGTGGDGQDTFNVSTSAAIVAAGMGLPVCKHGGKASTSSSGSGDLLNCLGVDASLVTAQTTPEILKKSGFCYLLAPYFHPVMGKVASIRGQLGIPTIFNILGPLINPIPLRARILGVYCESLGESYAKAAASLVTQSAIKTRTMVVHGDVGLDEISPIGFTKCWMVEPDGSIIRSVISPKDFGLPEHDLAEVKSGTPEENASILYHILRQDEPKFKVRSANEYGNHPLVDYILLNTAALAVVSGIASSWMEGTDLARSAIVSGAALQSLEDFKSAIKSSSE